MTAPLRFCSDEFELTIFNVNSDFIVKIGSLGKSVSNPLNSAAILLRRNSRKLLQIVNISNLAVLTKNGNICGKLWDRES